ncbi:hypothetical protein XENORESO_003315 [Xenotaenia resolanae]|uniref:Uncharacterized protein n=1 Tax=Xenotaenia resolanae TaxID=208358 RepID=A0ABV0WIN0_9TELE
MQLYTFPFSTRNFYASYLLKLYLHLLIFVVFRFIQNWVTGAADSVETSSSSSEGSHDPKFMAIGEGRNVDRPVNQELRFSAQLSLHQRTGTASPLLQQPHRSVCRFPALFSPHS